MIQSLIMLVKLLLLFFVFSFLFRTDLAFDQDLGRHIKLGEIILKTGSIPKNNLFSYTNSDFPFINTHWLFEVAAYWFSQTVGLEVLLVLKVVIILLSVYIILKIIPKESTAFLLPVGFIFLHVLRERLELRPEIFSFLFTASTYFILEKYLKTKTRLIFLLPAIQLLWINTHIYFFVGLILQGIFILHGIGRLKILGIVLVVSVLVSLFNPNGVTGLLYPLNVTKNYGYTIVENQTMFLLESINFQNPNFLFVKMAAGIILVSFVFVILKGVKNLKNKSRDPSLTQESTGLFPTQDDNRGRIKNILISLFGLTLALMNVRSFPYLVFLSLPATLGNFSTGFLSKLSPRWISAIVAVIILLESFQYLSGEYYRQRNSSHQVGLKMGESIKGALDFVQAFDLPGPIFNNFDIGSYIIYRGYPKYQVFVDGRPEAYPKEFFLDTYIPMQSDFAKFKKEEQKWGFKTIIFSHTDQTPWGQAFVQSIVRDLDWKIVYIDDFILALVKEDIATEKNLNKIDLAKLSPDQFSFDNHVAYLRMGIFLLNTQERVAGEKFLIRGRQPLLRN